MDTIEISEIARDMPDHLRFIEGYCPMAKAA